MRSTIHKFLIMTLLSIALFTPVGEAQSQPESSREPYERKVTKYRGMRAIEFHFTFSKGEIELRNSQLYMIHFNHKIFVSRDTASFYDAMISWEELPLDRTNVDSDKVVHHVTHAAKEVPFIINNVDLVKALIASPLLLISRNPPKRGFPLTSEHDGLYFMFEYDSLQIEAFLNKCNSINGIINIKPVRFGSNSLQGAIEPTTIQPPPTP